MTDLKKLRELAEYALTDRDNSSSLDAFQDSANPATVIALLDRLERAESVLMMALNIRETCNDKLGAWVSSKLALPIRKAARDYFDWLQSEVIHE